MALPLWFGGPPDTSSERSGTSPGDAELHRSRARESLEARETGASADPLLLRIEAGDASAFESLYRREYEPAVKFARRFVQSVDAAQDLVQDVFATVWERRTSLAVRGSARTYILSAVRHRALDVIRHTRVVDRATEESRNEIGSRDTGFRGMGTAPTDSAAEEAILLAAFQRVVAELPERQRSAVILRWEQQLSNREIAEVLEVGEAAVSRLLARAAEALVQLL